MSNDSITLDEVREEIQLTIDEIAHRGAQRMLAVALEADVEAYLAMPGQKDEQGRAQVVRNNYARERTIQSGAGIIKVKALRVYDKRAEQKFTNRILPPYMRKTPRLEVAVPVLYLRGLSTGDFREALAALLGEEAVAGFSATTVTRLLADARALHEVSIRLSREISDLPRLEARLDETQTRVREIFLTLFGTP